MIRWIAFVLLILGGISAFVYIKKEKQSEVPVVYIPYAVWCDGDETYFEPGETDCFQITKDGYKIATTSVTTGLKYFGNMASTSFLELSDTVDLISHSVKINSVSIQENGEYSLHSEHGDIYIQENQQTNTAIENLQVFLEAHKDQLYEYIDIRHGNSIFFKIKNEQKT